LCLHPQDSSEPTDQRRDTVPDLHVWQVQGKSCFENHCASILRTVRNLCIRGRERPSGRHTAASHRWTQNVNLKNAVFWDVALCGSCKNRLLVTANVVPIPPILVTLMIVTIRSSETSVLTRATRRNIPEDGILYSHRCENLKSYKMTILSFSN
jgi:hypothetical protein